MPRGRPRKYGPAKPGKRFLAANRKKYGYNSMSSFSPIEHSLQSKEKGIPNYMYCKFHFTQNLNSGSTASYANVYRTNSPYDLDRTGTGTSAEYFANLMAIYNSGVVYACKIKVTAAATAGAAGRYIAISDMGYQTSNPWATIVDVLADGRTTYKVCGGVNSSNAVVVKKFIKIKDSTGVGWNETDQQFTSTGNPAIGTNALISVASVDQATVGNTSLMVDITFYCRLGPLAYKSTEG